MKCSRCKRETELAELRVLISPKAKTHAYGRDTPGYYLCGPCLEERVQAQFDEPTRWNNRAIAAEKKLRRRAGMHLKRVTRRR